MNSTASASASSPRAALTLKQVHFRWLTTLAIACGAIIVFFPFFWMAVTSLKTAPEIQRVPLQIAPDNWLNLTNYIEVFKREPFLRFMLNSAIIASVAAVSVWVRIGFDTMIFLAALQSIPEEYYEAADMDGASAAQRLRYITLPLLNPQIIMVCILELIFNFKIFDQVYATTQGGPAGASQTIIMLLYDTAFKFFRFGDASVMAVFVFITLMAVTLLQWRIFRKPVEY